MNDYTERQIRELWRKLKPGEKAQQTAANLSLRLPEDVDIPDWAWDLTVLAAQYALNHP